MIFILQVEAKPREMSTLPGHQQVHDGYRNQTQGCLSVCLSSSQRQASGGGGGGRLGFLGMDLIQFCKGPSLQLTFHSHSLLVDCSWTSHDDVTERIAYTF